MKHVQERGKRAGEGKRPQGRVFGGEAVENQAVQKEVVPGRSRPESVAHADERGTDSLRFHFKD